MWLFHPASLQGWMLRSDWLVFTAAGAFVALCVWALIVLPLILWRERPGRESARFTGNPKLELSYTILPLIAVAALFIYTLRHEIVVDRVAAHPENVVDVRGFRWSWQFTYAGSNVTVTGTPDHPPTLFLPQGRTTEFDITSNDVDHAFWIPAFLFQRDAIPGTTNVVDITPQTLGTYTGRCAQYCGLEHTRMAFVVRVVPARDFDAYIASGGAHAP